MPTKLQIQLCAASALASFLLVGCSPEPLTPEEESTLKLVYMTMPDHQAVAIKQNLRLTGLYQGELNLNFTPELAEAINQVHFDLNLVEQDFQLDSQSAASKFLQELASPSIRPRLVSELSTSPAEFVQTQPPSTELRREGRKCIVNGGTYSRSGEEISISFYKIGRQAGIELTWDGWPGATFPRLIPVAFDDMTLPMMIEYQRDAPTVRADAFNENGSWVIDAMRQGEKIEIGPDTEIAPLELPTGDLYQTALALEGCG